VLNGQALARGGEAAIYEVPHQPTLVAKVYHQPTPEHADKLAAMIAAPPTDPMAGKGHVSIAWPVDRLLEAATPRFLGYVMPRVDRVQPLIDFYNPGSRLQRCPLFHYGYLLRTARNLAAAVRAIHERGYVIGDLNESNILVNNMALVTLVDTDSFQVPGPRQVHRCPVGKPEYTPPELQGARFADFDRGPEHDAFALAILVFQLLMQGIHPFAGRYTGSGDPPGLSERIAAGHWPYARGRRVPFAPNPHAPPFDTLPPRIQELMRRCFEDGHARSALRPDAAAWHQALLESEKELARCPANPKQHVFNGFLHTCPWCAMARRQGRDLFPSPEDVEAGRVGSRPAPVKPPEVVQVALAPAPMSPQRTSRDTAVRAAVGSVTVAVPVASVPAASSPVAGRPTDLPAVAFPVAAVRPPAPAAVPARPADLEWPNPMPAAAARRQIPWPWVIGGSLGGLALLIIGVIGLVLSNRPKSVQETQSQPPTENLPRQVKPGASKVFAHGPCRFLSELPEFDVHKGEWPFRKGDCGNGKPIEVSGVRSPNGLGMHPPAAPGRASVKYRLEKEAALLKATVAINDTTTWCWSPATFTVLGDGKELWRSEAIAHNHARSQHFQVLVEGVDVLELRVEVVNGNQGVHAVWVEPRVLQKIDSPDPVATQKSEEKKELNPEPATAKDLDPKTLAVIRQAARTGNFSQTTMIGFPHHTVFQDVPMDGGLLIGFEIGIGKFLQNDVIHSIQPIFLTARGEVRGQVHGKPTDRMVTVKARKGYAVGSVTINAHLLIDGLRVTFMKVDGKYLDTDQSYQSPPIASLGDATSTLSSKAGLVIGICGRDGGACDALGLVVRGK
jgi:serine/threonine protein kinase